MPSAPAVYCPGTGSLFDQFDPYTEEPYTEDPYTEEPYDYPSDYPTQYPDEGGLYDDSVG